MAAPVRLQNNIGSSWMQPYQVAAELAVEAGRAKGQVAANILGGVAQGISGAGARIDARQARAEAKAERAKDDDLRRRGLELEGIRLRAGMLDDLEKSNREQMEEAAYNAELGMGDPSDLAPLADTQARIQSARAALALQVEQVTTRPLSGVG